jgi:hypothetical protein
MKKIFLVFFILFTSLIGNKLSANEKKSVDWVAIKEAFLKYVNHPSNQNAVKVISILPETPINYSAPSQEMDEALEYMYQSRPMEILEHQILSKNREAIRLVFRLRAFADGGFGEGLDIILGKLIKIDPKLFLEELNTVKPIVARYDSLLGNYGNEYVDNLKASCRETKLRINALKTVKGPSLKKIRNNCIEILESSSNDSCK